jgi:hypothetical protein
LTDLANALEGSPVSQFCQINQIASSRIGLLPPTCDINKIKHLRAPVRSHRNGGV